MSTFASIYNMRNHLLFTFFLLITWSCALCQDNFSESFFYSPKNIHVYVPALTNPEGRFQSNIAYRTYIGKLSIIRTQYADANFRLGKLDEKETVVNKHVLGLGVYSDREGEFFSKSRILFRYALHLPLNEQLTLAGGAAFHVVNYNFHASGSGASGSAITWTGNIAAGIYSPTFRVGVSFNDFNNPQIKPINYPFQLYRYATFYAEKEMLIAEDTYIRGAGKYNVVSGNSSSFLGQLGLIFSRSIGVSYFFYANRGWGLSAEINKIKLGQEHKIDFVLAYQVPGKDQNPPSSQYELNLRYYLKK